MSIYGNFVHFVGLIMRKQKDRPKWREPMRISHYSTTAVVIIFYMKPMDIASIKTHGKYYSQETLEVYYLKAPKKISFTK